MVVFRLHIDTYTAGQAFIVTLSHDASMNPVFAVWGKSIWYMACAAPFLLVAVQEGRLPDVSSATHACPPELIPYRARG